MNSVCSSVSDPSSDSVPGVIATIVDDLASVPEIELVVLFGSRAIGDSGPRSDIDLAIAAPSADVFRRAEIRDRVETAPTLLMIDLVWLDRVPDSLRERIDRDGRVLFERTAA